MTSFEIPIKDPVKEIVSPSLLLEKAEHYLREFGWIQHQNQNEDGMCLLYALNQSIHFFYGRHDWENEEEPAEVSQAWDALESVTSSDSIVGWNDEEDTDFNKVVKALREARYLV